MRTRGLQLLVVCALFLCGHTQTLNDTLIPYLQDQLSFSYTRIMLLQFCTFTGYLLCCPLAALLIIRTDYVRGLLFGVALGCAGVLMLQPAIAEEHTQKNI